MLKDYLNMHCPWSVTMSGRGHVSCDIYHKRVHFRVRVRDSPAFHPLGRPFRPAGTLVYISMPKDTGDDCGGTRYTATNQDGLKTLASQLRVDNKGVDAQEIVSYILSIVYALFKIYFVIGDHVSYGGPARRE